MDEQDREIYPNAPLRFVAFELRTPQVPAFATREGTAALYDALRDLVPIIAPQSMIEVPPALNAVAVAASSGSLRMLDRKRTLSVTVNPSALIVENTAYERFEHLLEVINRVLTAAASAAPIAGMQRIGLRYIDEIRVPGLSSPREWASYIDSSLLAAAALGTPYEASTTQGVTEFKIAENYTAVMRFGALVGRAVDPNGPLRVKGEEEGPFFLIDLDSFWTAPTDETPEFSEAAVTEICIELRAPVRTLFEASISDQLRDQVFRKELA